MRDILTATTAVASAVEEQNAATGDIARSVQLAADGTEKLAVNIAEVRSEARETERNAGAVLDAARTMRSQSSLIEEEVSTFVRVLQEGPLARRQGGSDGPHPDRERRARIA